MKSEHRHELADNDLEKYINKSRARFAELMEVHGNRIMLWSSAALLMLAAWIFYSSSNKSANAEGWEAFTSAQTPEEFAAVAENFNGTTVGNWANLNVGEQYMQSGLRLMFKDREDGIADLKVAQKAFESTLNNIKVSGTVRERALFGLARVLESTAGDDLKPAIETYQKLLADFPNSAYTPVVEKQIKVLESKSNQEFYAWFAVQKPKLIDRELPKDFLPNSNDPAGTTAIPGEKPTGEMKPGEVPTSTVPTAPDFPPKKEEPKKTTEKPVTKPVTKPTTEKPTTEKPTTEKPAATKPAAEVPKKTSETKPAKKPEAKPAPDTKLDTPKKPKPIPEAAEPAAKKPVAGDK